jgi:hypothetical protein
VRVQVVKTHRRGPIRRDENEAVSPQPFLETSLFRVDDGFQSLYAVRQPNRNLVVSSRTVAFAHGNGHLVGSKAICQTAGDQSDENGDFPLTLDLLSGCPFAPDRVQAWVDADGLLKAVGVTSGS